MLRDLHVLRFVLIYALMQMSTYGAIFYLPAEVSALLHKPAGFEVGLVTAIPWMCTLAAVYFLPRLADERRNHRQVAALILLVAGGASFVFPTAGPRVGILVLSIAVSGFISVQPIFWTFPTAYLADVAAAGGIALIGTGNVGGFLAPNLKVWADEHFHSPRAGLYAAGGAHGGECGVDCDDSTAAGKAKRSIEPADRPNEPWLAAHRQYSDGSDRRCCWR